MIGHLAEGAFRRHYGDVYRFLVRRTADAGEAEELTQQVFADAAAAERHLEDERPLLPWLLAVAHRRWVDEQRRRRREREGLERLAAGASQEAVSDDELQAAIRRAVRTLPPEQRDVVIPRLLQGERFREIASGLGVSEAAVKMRFRRGLDLLRERLREEGYEP